MSGMLRLAEDCMNMDTNKLKSGKRDNIIKKYRFFLRERERERERGGSKPFVGTDDIIK